MDTPKQQASKPQKTTQAAPRGGETASEPDFAPASTDRSFVQRMGLDPSRLAPAEILYLQKTAGNQAVQRLLGRDSAQRQGPQPVTPQPQLRSGAPVIQRLAYNDRPLDIAPQSPPGVTREVWKSPQGEGQTGVYFAQESTPPPAGAGVGERVEKIVLKFTTVQEAQKSEFANAVIRTGAELGAPQTVVYQSGVPGGEYTAIGNQLKQWKGRPQREGSRLDAHVDDDVAASDLEPKALTVMEAVQGETMMAMARTPGRQNALLSALDAPGVIQGLAKMLVVDAILGNQDRILKPAGEAGERAPANLGNIFVHAGQDPRDSTVSTIDSEVTSAFGLPSPGNADLFLRDIVAITDDATVEVAVDRLFETITHVAPNLAASLQAMRGDIVRRMKGAVKQERVNILKRIKSNKGELKHAHAGIGRNLPAKAMPSWDRFRARAKVLEEKNAAKGQINALEVAMKHLEHRDKQNKEELPRQQPVKMAKKAAQTFKGFFK